MSTSDGLRDIKSKHLCVKTTTGSVASATTHDEDLEQPRVQCRPQAYQKRK